MPRAPSFFHPLRQIRTRSTFRTQQEFAKFIGVSTPTVQAIENGKLRLSRKLALRIERATGADHRELLKGALGKPKTIEGNPFTQEHFECWIELQKQPDKSDELKVSQLSFWIKILVEAATKTDISLSQKSAVFHGVADALDSICQDSGLEAAAEKLLTPLKTVEYKSSSPHEWIKNSKFPGNALEKFANRFHPDARVVVSIEKIPRWTPGRPVPGGLIKT